MDYDKKTSMSVKCPLIDAPIGIIECSENSDIVRGLFVEESLPEEYKRKANWKDICKNCKWYNY